MVIKKEKEFNKIKLKESEKGITLIALVITIIVLLILAAVSIAMLTGENGILNKVSKSKEETLKAEAEECIKLVILEWKTEKEVGNKTIEQFLTSKVPNEIDAYDEMNDLYVLKKNGYAMMMNDSAEIEGKIISENELVRLDNDSLIRKSKANKR